MRGYDKDLSNFEEVVDCFFCPKNIILELIS